jgi:hypothetical protein
MNTVEEYLKERKESLKDAVEKVDYIEKSMNYLKENVVEFSDRAEWTKSQK